MRNWIAGWIVNTLALFIITRLNIGIHVDKDSMVTLLIAVIVLGLVNSFIRPIVMLLALPINCLTFGLFSFVINALLFQLVGSKLVPGFHVDNFMAAFIGSILMGLLSGFFNLILKESGDKE